MLIYNELGFDNFTHIDGNSGVSDLSVKVVTVMERGTRNLPRIICYQYANLERLTIHAKGIVELSAFSIRNCYYLQYLDLSHNLIETIDESTFANFISIAEINLESNRLTTIDDYHFADLLAVHTLNLRNNIGLQMSPLALRYE